MCYKCEFLDLLYISMSRSFTYLIYPMPNDSKIIPVFLIQVQKHFERGNFTNSATSFYTLTGNI